MGTKIDHVLSELSAIRSTQKDHGALLQEHGETLAVVFDRSERYEQIERDARHAKGWSSVISAVISAAGAALSYFWPR
jgi:hypothetical protein